MVAANRNALLITPVRVKGEGHIAMQIRSRNHHARAREGRRKKFAYREAARLITPVRVKGEGLATTFSLLAAHHARAREGRSERPRFVLRAVRSHPCA